MTDDRPLFRTLAQQVTGCERVKIPVKKQKKKCSAFIGTALKVIALQA